MNSIKTILSTFLSTTLIALSSASAATLSRHAESVIPREVQELIVMDYRSMQTSETARLLENEILPSKLRALEATLTTSGLDVDHATDTLTFASFHDETGSHAIGVAEGQFQTHELLTTFRKHRVRTATIRNNNVYLLPDGYMVTFVDQTIMLFGDEEAIRTSLDVKDGLRSSLLANGEWMSRIDPSDTRSLWSLSDQTASKLMMSSVLGDAAHLVNFNAIADRLRYARYSMDFRKGFSFEMNVIVSDTLTASAVAAIMRSVALVTGSIGASRERTAVDRMSIDSRANTVGVTYQSSDGQFIALLTSPFFQKLVR